MPTILLVDDDKFVRELLRDALERIPLDGPLSLIEASDGMEGVAAAARDRPDLVFLDLLMPNKSGLEALPEIRARSPESRVVVVSSMETESMAKEALEAGAMAFIGKPFHPHEIQEIVRRAFGIDRG